jgi:hypothetical protein
VLAQQGCGQHRQRGVLVAAGSDGARHGATAPDKVGVGVVTANGRVTSAWDLPAPPYHRWCGFAGWPPLA